MSGGLKANQAGATGHSRALPLHWGLSTYIGMVVAHEAVTTRMGLEACCMHVVH